MIETIQDTASFARLREEWNELLRDSASDCLFLTWEWVYTWWKHLSRGRRLRLVTLRRGRDLVAIAPLAVRPPRVERLLPFRLLELIGTPTGVSDYLDLIARRGHEVEAVQALGEYLGGAGFMLELARVRQGAGLAAELARELRQRRWTLAEARTDLCPFINLSGHSWESYLATLGRKHRSNFRRGLKNLSGEFDARFERVSSEPQRREALAALVELHNMRWRERGGSSAFHTGRLLSFHEEMTRLALERGWLRLFILRVNGNAAASLYGFRYGRTFYYYQSGFDPRYSKYGLGLLSVGLSIRSAIEEGAEEYDLLRGDEPYKLNWAPEARQLMRLTLYPPRLSGFALRRAEGLGWAVRKTVRRMLSRAVADRLARGLGIGG